MGVVYGEGLQEELASSQIVSSLEYGLGGHTLVYMLFYYGAKRGREVTKILFSMLCASQGRCFLHTWWLSNMSGLWLPEARNSTGKPILDLCQPKCGHLRCRPLHFYYGAKRGFSAVLRGFGSYVTRDIYV